MKRMGLGGLPVALVVAAVVAMAALGSGCSDDSATGNDNNNVPPGCGNGIVEADLGESCDDGPGNSDLEPNACRTSCQVAGCGDNVRDSGEDCDGDDLNGSICADLPFLNHGTLRCTLDCTFDTDECYQCGDGTIDPGEECDTDTLGEVDSEPANCGNVTGKPDGVLACQTDCMYDITDCALCGDGVIEGPEECDDASDNSDQPNADCRLNCQTAGCGDGIWDFLIEGCDCGTDASGIPPGCSRENDDGYQNGCSSNCEAPYCGDGKTDSLGSFNTIEEACDEGANNCDDPNSCTCTSMCAVVGCGDGIFDPNIEECDCGEDASHLGPGCQEPNCNNSVTCECTTACTFPGCGNGIVEPHLDEACDEGDTNNCDTDSSCTCATSCKYPACGNGATEAYRGEECDLGGSNCDAAGCQCGMTCLIPRCGNGYPDPGEECDCGDNAQQQTCTRLNCDDAADCTCAPGCVNPGCGNGVPEAYAGEGCDEGSGNCDVPGCTCTTTCAVPWIVERQPQGSQDHLTAVWTDGTVAWAVGFSGTVLHRNAAGTWTPAASPAFTTLRAIWADSENSVLVVGDNRTLLSYSGANWQDDSAWVSSVTPTTMDFTGVECWNLATLECAVSGSDGSIITLHTSPFLVAWTNSAPYSTTTYNDIAVTINPFVGPYLLAVGDQGTWLPAYPWDTPGWSPDHQNQTVDNLEAIWLQSVGNGWVVGEGGLIFHGVGGIWSGHTSHTNETLLDVVGTATEAYAVGAFGTIRRYPGSGSDWVTETSLHNQHLRGVAAAAGLVLAVGDDGIILRRP